MIEHVRINIETGNAAFEETPASEIARILRKLADDFENSGEPSHYIRDINGNVCGDIQILKEGE